MAFSTLDGSGNYTTTKPTIPDSELANNKWYNTDSIISSDEWNVLRDNIIYAMTQANITPNGEEDDTVLKRLIDAYVAGATAGQGLADSTSLIDYVASERDSDTYDDDGNPTGEPIGLMRILDDASGWTYKKYTYAQRRDTLLNNTLSNAFEDKTIFLSNDTQNYRWIEIELEWAGPPWPICNKFTFPAQFLTNWEERKLSDDDIRIMGGVCVARDANTSVILYKDKEDTISLYKDNDARGNVVISKIYGLT